MCPLLYCQESADTSLLAALGRVANGLRTSPAIANLTIALPTIGSAIAPLYWSYFSERYGRRLTYLVSLTFFVTFSVLAATSTSINTLLSLRMLSSFAGCAVTATGAAVISDVWHAEARGRAMSGYYIGVLTGPVIGPIIGGLLVQNWDWRALQWFLVVYGATGIFLIFFTLPETLREEPLVMTGTEGGGLVHEVPTTLTRPNKLIFAGRKGLEMLFGPLRIVALFRSPIILINIYLASNTFLVVRMFAVVIQDDFSSIPYSLNGTRLGLVFLPYTVGLFVGDVFAGKWSDYRMRSVAIAAGRYDSEGELIYYPEDRVRENAWIGILLFSGSLIWYGWSIRAGSFWPVPVGFHFLPQCLLQTDRF